MVKRRDMSGTIPEKAEIPEPVIRKLSKACGLKYADKHRKGGGGVCLGVGGYRSRRRALLLLGELISSMGKGSTDKAIGVVGATWLDVMVWQEDKEYKALWDAADQLRDKIAGARLKDDLWDRSLNGYETEEAKNIGGKLEAVTVKKVDNGLGIGMLKGLGFIGREGRRSLVTKSVLSSAADDGANSESGESKSVDTVLFPDRAIAFKMMGKDGEGGGK